jgi:hypothetical protein
MGSRGGRGSQRHLARAVALAVMGLASLVGGSVAAPVSAASSSWTAATAPTGPGGEGVVSSLTCVDASHCWLVGFSQLASFGNTLIDADQGGAWSNQSSPDVSYPNSPLDSSDYLSSVACPSVTECWAVGSYDLGQAVSYPLVLQYSGTSWSLVQGPSIPAVGALGALLYGVTCLSPSNCWAVGQATGTLVEHFTGTVWSVVPSPNSGNSGEDGLSAVTCHSAKSCWAVGWQDQPPGTVGGKPLIESYDGKTWQVVSSPDPGGKRGYSLSAVSCPTASSCWAVGGVPASSSGPQQRSEEPLIERLQGSHWAATETTLKGGATLSGISCPNQSTCWAVGSNPKDQDLLERLHGGSWTALPPTAGLGLAAITCLPQGECWSAGPAYVQGSAAQSPIQLFQLRP